MVIYWAKLLVVASCCVLCAGFRWPLVWGDLSWDAIHAEIKEEYPDVTQMTTDELLGHLGQARMVLVDVREPEEFEVSHLPGAVLSESLDPEVLQKNIMVVAYCSVGLRSAAFVRKLQKRGFTNVYNLQGSIFEWANKGYPLLSDTAKVEYVHPFNKRWGVLLNRKFHRYKEAQQDSEQ